MYVWVILTGGNRCFVSFYFRNRQRICEVCGDPGDGDGDGGVDDSGLGLDKREELARPIPTGPSVSLIKGGSGAGPNTGPFGRRHGRTNSS